MEKDPYILEGKSSPDTDNHIKSIVEQKGAAIGEATDLYGDVQTAEAYGYVNRG